MRDFISFIIGMFLGAWLVCVLLDKAQKGGNIASEIHTKTTLIPQDTLINVKNGVRDTIYVYR